MLPPPFDVAANVAAYGEDATVDADGIYVDTTRGERFARTMRGPFRLRIRQLDRMPQMCDTKDDVTAQDVLQMAKDARAGKDDSPNLASLSGPIATVAS